VVEKSRSQHPRTRVVAPVGRRGDDREPAHTAVGVMTNLAQKPIAVFTRHSDVGQDDVGRHLRDDLQCLARTHGDCDDGAASLESERKIIEGRRIVIDDEDLDGCQIGRRGGVPGLFGVSGPAGTDGPRRRRLAGRGQRGVSTSALRDASARTPTVSLRSVTIAGGCYHHTGAARYTEGEGGAVDDPVECFTPPRAWPLSLPLPASESTDRQGPRPHDPAVTIGAGGSGDRVNQLPYSAAVGSRRAADPVHSSDYFRRGDVANRQDGIGQGARDAEPAYAGGLVELDTRAGRPPTTMIPLCLRALLISLAAVGMFYCLVP
jgi:hypothetical protein